MRIFKFNLIFFSFSVDLWEDHLRLYSFSKKDLFYFVPEILIVVYLLLSLIFLVTYFSKLRNNDTLTDVQSKYYLKLLTIKTCLNLLRFCQIIFIYFIFLFFFFQNFTLIFQGFFIFDAYSQFCKLIITFTFTISLFFSFQFLAFESEGLLELPILLGFSFFFNLLLVISFDLFLTYLIMEALTFLICILIASNYRSSLALESALKYFIVSSLASAFVLFGILWIFILTKQTNFLNFKLFFCFMDYRIFLILDFPVIFLILGFLIKLGAFPFSIWVPDVYEGCSAFITFYMIVCLKSTFILFFLRFIFFLFIDFAPSLSWIILGSSLGAFIFGALGAFSQKTIKRFFAYTSLNQLGFIFLACASQFDVGIAGVASALIFLITYIINNILFFGVFLSFYNSKLMTTFHYLVDFKGFGYFYPWHALALSLAVFSFVGLPPLAGFFSKFLILIAAAKSGSKFYIIFFALISNGLSAYYYIKLVKIIWFESITDLKIKSFYFKNFSQAQLTFLIFSSAAFNLLAVIFLNNFVETLTLLSLKCVFPFF